jgi:hypothetical protein
MRHIESKTNAKMVETGAWRLRDCDIEGRCEQQERNSAHQANSGFHCRTPRAPSLSVRQSVVT